MAKTAFLGVVIAPPTVEPGFDGVTVVRFSVAFYPFDQNVVFDIWTIRDQANFCISHISVGSLVYIEGQSDNVGCSEDDSSPLMIFIHADRVVKIGAGT